MKIFIFCCITTLFELQVVNSSISNSASSSKDPTQVAVVDIIGPTLPPHIEVIDYKCVPAQLVNPSKAYSLVQIVLSLILENGYKKFASELPYSTRLENEELLFTVHGVVNCYSIDNLGNTKNTMMTSSQCLSCLKYIREELLQKRCRDSVSVFFELEDCYLGYDVDGVFDIKQ